MTTIMEIKKDYITVKEFAKLTGYSRSNIYNAIDAGRVIAIKESRGLSNILLIPFGEVEKIIKQKGAQPRP